MAVKTRNGVGRALPAAAIGLIGAALAVAGCGGSDSGNEATAKGDGGSSHKPIVIGLASGQTGSYSFYDKPVGAAVQMAVKDINAAGGVDGRKLSVVVRDTKSDTNQSAQAATEVVDEGSDFVVTMCDFDYGAPAAREAQKRGKPAFSCAGSPLFGPAGIGPLAFSVSEGAPTQGAVGAQFAIKRGWKTAYLLEDVSTDYTKTWCNYFKTRFTQDGGTIVGHDTFQSTDQSMSSQVTRMASGKPADVVALCGFPPSAATAIRQARAAGVTAPILGTAGFDGPFWVGAVPGVSNVYVTAAASLFGDDPNPKVNELVKRFKQETGKAPETAYFLYGYAIVQAIKAAVEEAGTTDGAKVASALTGRATDLVLGPTTYTARCHIALGRPMRIVQYQKGKGSFVESVDPGKVPTPAACAER